jgi:hypothetical protein
MSPETCERVQLEKSLLLLNLYFQVVGVPASMRYSGAMQPCIQSAESGRAPVTRIQTSGESALFHQTCDTDTPPLILSGPFSLHRPLKEN